MHILNVANAGVISNAPGVANIGIKILFFLLSVFGIIAIIMLVVYSAMYFLSFGDEGKIAKAKKAISIWTMAIILAMGSMVAVNLISKILQ